MISVELISERDRRAQTASLESNNQPKYHVCIKVGLSIRRVAVYKKSYREASWLVCSDPAETSRVQLTECMSHQISAAVYLFLNYICTRKSKE